MLYVYNTSLCLQRIDGIFDKDDAKNVVTGLDGKLEGLAFLVTQRQVYHPSFYALLRNVQFRNDYFRA